MEHKFSSLGIVRAEQCPLSCSSHGSCYAHLSARWFPAICLCDLHWMGANCSIRRINPFRVQAHGTQPHWPELMDLKRQKELASQWQQRAGVSCGGARFARNCSQCLRPHETVQHLLCTADCMLQGGRCVAALMPGQPRADGRRWTRRTLTRRSPQSRRQTNAAGTGRERAAWISTRQNSTWTPAIAAKNWKARTPSGSTPGMK